MKNENIGEQNNMLGERELAYVQSSVERVYKLVKELAVIPAPSGFEKKRADFVKKYIEDLGFCAEIDDAGNVIWKIGVREDNPLYVYSAHMDVVFSDTEYLPLSEDDKYIYAPGIGDDTLRLSILLVAAEYAARQYAESDRADLPGLLIVANTCEEGLGNLKGVRKLVDTYRGRIKELITIDGNPQYIITRAVGSHRYKVAAKTAGGHSFNAFGNKNAIAVLADIINRIYATELPQKDGCKTTFNVGTIEGGTSVNTIAQSAEMLAEYRSDDATCLAEMKEKFAEIFSSQRQDGVQLEAELIGERPCGAAADRAAFGALVERAKSVEKLSIGIDPLEVSGSTDANYPLSLGIPAVCVGAGVAYKTHTREEYIEKGSFSEGLTFVLALLLSTPGMQRQ